MIFSLSVVCSVFFHPPTVSVLGYRKIFLEEGEAFDENLKSSKGVNRGGDLLLSYFFNLKWNA